MRNGMNKFIIKVIRVLSWTMGLSLIMSLLMGGINAWGIPYQGMDMPIRLQDNEDVYWAKIVEAEYSLYGNTDGGMIRGVPVIFKALWSYLGEGVRIGRGPPKIEKGGPWEKSGLKEINPSLIKT